MNPDAATQSEGVLHGDSGSPRVRENPGANR